MADNSDIGLSNEMQTNLAVQGDRVKELEKMSAWNAGQSLLLETADESAKDVHGLHAKLDRMHLVDGKHAKTQEHFYEVFCQIVAAMTKGLLCYDEQHCRTIPNVHKDIDLLLKTRSAEVRSLSDSMSRVIDVVNKSHRAHEHHVHGIHEGLGKFIAESEEVQNSEVARNFVAEELSRIVDTLNGIAADLEGLRIALNDRVTAQQRMTKDFVKTQLIYLSTCLKSVESHCIPVIEGTGSQLKALREFDEEYSALSKNLTENLIKDLIRMVQGLKEVVDKQGLSLSSQVQQ